MPNTSAITNLYDGLARLTTTTLWTSGGSALNVHAYQFNNAHRRTRQDRSGGSYVEYLYDNAGQLLHAWGKESSATPRLQERLEYAYDGAGNLITRTNNALVQSFAVNNLNELSSGSQSGTITVAGMTSASASAVTVSGSSAALYGDWTFAATNLTVTNGINVFTAVGTDSLGRSDTNIVTANLPASPAWLYDGNGNLLSDGWRAFTYDDENQLTTVVVTNAWRSDFVYDGLGRRQARFESEWRGGAWVTNQEVRYMYDGRLVVQERWHSPSIGSSFPLQTISYTRGNDISGSVAGAGGTGGLLARTDSAFSSIGDGTAAHAYYHADGSGNITALQNSQQIVVARYLYDPFGNDLGRIGPLAEANLYRFSGKELHIGSGLYYNGFRYYEPNLQRWLNRDPIQEAGGINLYGFVGNDPINRIDALGLWQVTITWGVGPGFSFTFGRNSGQNNIGLRLGAGVGLSLGLDFVDQGKRRCGFNPNLSVAVSGGDVILGAGAEAGVTGDGPYGSVSGRLGLNTVNFNGSVDIPGDMTFTPNRSVTTGHGNWGFSGFVGAGGTVTW